MKDHHKACIRSFVRGLVDGTALCVLVLVCLWVYHL
jgi:hypothetical protein